MKQSVTTSWLGNMAFESEVNGHKLIIDAAEENGGENKGPRPKTLMLTALAGCTGMDVVSILKKMRVRFKSLNIIVEGDITEEHPKHFIKMHVIFEFTGTDLPLDKIKEAIRLSEERYCGVGASYRKVMVVTSEIRIIEG